jgi:hypothetical protein
MRNWGVAQGFPSSYNDYLKEQAKSHKMQLPLQNQPHRTYSKYNSENTYNKD